MSYEVPLLPFQVPSPHAAQSRVDHRRAKASDSAGSLNFRSRRDRLFNAMLAAVLLVASSPLLLVVAVLVGVSGRGPLLFRSRRLGENKKPFDMLKFRTLVVDAESVLGDSQLTTSRAADLGVEHRFGRFLRETRLDELPQLVNVLKGEMSLVGPRPVRPELYERTGRHIPGYERRFLKAPGLVGYSQLFTPHSTSKRLRSLIDNRYAVQERSYLSDLRLLVLAAHATVRRAVRLGARAASEFARRLIRGQWRERRRRLRTPLARSRVRFPGVPGEKPGLGDLVDINDEALLVHTEFELPVEESFALVLETEVRQGSRSNLRHRLCHCRGRVRRRWSRNGDGSSFAAVVTYTPDTPLNAYRAAKYFLRESFF